MKKKGIGRLGAVLMSAALAVQCLAVPAMAEETDSAVLDEITSLGSMEDMFGQSMTAQIKVTGSVDAGDAGLFEIDVDATEVTDLSAAAQSLSGKVEMSGASYEFSEYMDGDTIMLKVPFVPSVLSYDYQSDPAGSYLEQVFGYDYLYAINKILQLSHAAMGGNMEGMTSLGEEISEIFTEASGQLSFEIAPEKECLVGGEEVVCQGVQSVITAELAEDVVTKLLGCTLPNGQTYEEYFDMCLAMSGSGEGMPESTAEAVDSFLSEMPDMTLTMYVTEAGTLVEMGLAAEEGGTMALQMRGPEEAFWSDMVLVMDDTEIAAVGVETDEEGAMAISFAAQGAELCELVLYPDMSFELSVAVLPSPITGNITMDESGLGIHAEYDALVVDIVETAGGEVEIPEGEVLELSTMTEEDFNSMMESLGALFGAFDTAA